MTTLTVRAMYAEDDIVPDMGYDGFCVYMVIDPEAERRGDDPCRYVSLTESDAIAWIATSGHTYVPEAVLYVYKNAWVLRD